MKYIFLDLDGILITRASWAVHKGADPNCITALNTITNRTGAEIVISSSWRLSSSLAELRSMLHQWGVAGVIIDVTPRIPMSERGIEIQTWLRQRASLMDPFVVLDDDKNMGPIEPHRVQPDTEHGLTFAQAHAAIRILESSPVNPALATPEPVRIQKVEQPFIKVRGKIEYPADHQPGMQVPKGGSSCQSCKFLKDAENRICGNTYFIEWNKSEVIPLAIDEYCSDWYVPKKGALKEN